MLAIVIQQGKGGRMKSILGIMVVLFVQNSVAFAHHGKGRHLSLAEQLNFPISQLSELSDHTRLSVLGISSKYSQNELAVIGTLTTIRERGVLRSLVSSVKSGVKKKSYSVADEIRRPPILEN